jgi:hypothetical protein
MLLLVFAALIADPMVEPTITTTVVPPEGTVGDEIVLRVAVKHAEADAFEFPLEPAFGPFDQVDRASSQKQEGPIITEEIVFKIASYDVGEHEIPKITFRVGGKEFSTEAKTVNIASVVADDPAATHAIDTQPTRKPDGEPFAIYERVYWPFYLAGLVLAVVAAYIAWKRRKPQIAMQEELSPHQIPAHEAALVLLRLLREKKLLQQGKTREYYFEATEIMRAYVSQRYAINALDLTTAEVMEKLAGISAPGLDREGLRTWLDHADLVKFAKLNPPIDKGAQMVDFFEQLVWSTRPPAPKSVEAAA